MEEEMVKCDCKELKVISDPDNQRKEDSNAWFRIITDLLFRN